MPFAGLGILYSLIRKTSLWPQWKAPFGYWAPVILCIAVVYAGVNGYLIQGEWGQWALINKMAGFAILMAYLALGAWIVTNADKDIMRPFFYIFAAFFCISFFIDLFFYVRFWEFKDQAFHMMGRNLDGFMYNRSAFGFLFISIALLINEILSKPERRSKFENFLLYAFWALAPVFTMLNSSRILWLCLIPIFIFNAVRYPRFFFTRIVPLFVLGATLTFLLMPDSQRLMLKPLHLTAHAVNAESIANTAPDNLNTSYDIPRLKVLSEGLNLYAEHPVRGAGLGAIVDHQTDKYGKVLTVLDNTPLWILTEMGPFGLFAFAWVYLVMLAALMRKNGNGTHSDFAMGAAFMLLGFGVFSLFHEILYSRFMWFILGMALAVPIKLRQSE